MDEINSTLTILKSLHEINSQITLQQDTFWDKHISNIITASVALLTASMAFIGNYYINKNSSEFEQKKLLLEKTLDLKIDLYKKLFSSLIAYKNICKFAPADRNKAVMSDDYFLENMIAKRIEITDLIYTIEVFIKNEKFRNEITSQIVQFLELHRSFYNSHIQEYKDSFQANKMIDFSENIHKKFITFETENNMLEKFLKLKSMLHNELFNSISNPHE